jgi:hypothetical protein
MKDFRNALTPVTIIKTMNQRSMHNHLSIPNDSKPKVKVLVFEVMYTLLALDWTG